MAKLVCILRHIEDRDALKLFNYDFYLNQFETISQQSDETADALAGPFMSDIFTFVKDLALVEKEVHRVIIENNWMATVPRVLYLRSAMGSGTGGTVAGTWLQAIVDNASDEIIDKGASMWSYASEERKDITVSKTYELEPTTRGQALANIQMETALKAFWEGRLKTDWDAQLPDRLLQQLRAVEPYVTPPPPPPSPKTPDESGKGKEREVAVEDEPYEFPGNFQPPSPVSKKTEVMGMLATRSEKEKTRGEADPDLVDVEQREVEPAAPAGRRPRIPVERKWWDALESALSTDPNPKVTAMRADQFKLMMGALGYENNGNSYAPMPWLLENYGAGRTITRWTQYLEHTKSGRIAMVAIHAYSIRQILGDRKSGFGSQGLTIDDYRPEDEPSSDEETGGMGDDDTDGEMEAGASRGNSGQPVTTLLIPGTTLIGALQNRHLNSQHGPNDWHLRAATMAPFKVLIIGGGVAGLSLAIMLEMYGFEYELLEKHGDVAPKLGAGVGLTPNGARILDQIGVWESMCERASPVNAGLALDPMGQTVISNPNMGEWLEKLFGYKIHFLSRHDCLRILFGKIQQKSNIHLRKEVVKISPGHVGERASVQTRDGSVYTADLVIGADGVRSNVRSELWRVADAEKPGYIPRRDKEGILRFIPGALSHFPLCLIFPFHRRFHLIPDCIQCLTLRPIPVQPCLLSLYTAVIGIAHDAKLPRGGSARAYNHYRSYFFQEGLEGSGEFYWWLCAKNEKPIRGIVPKLSPEVKQALLDKYADDRIGPGLTLGSLYKSSVYSTVIPLQEFVLEKCFYKNILLIGDSFRKLHPVAGQGANSTVEESALVADILWDHRERGALHDSASVEQALTDFQKERFVRTTALREDANLVQRMESLDNPVMKFMALHVIPRLPFTVAFLPQLAASFTPARHLKHAPPPRAGLCPFSQEMNAKPSPRSALATLSWVGALLLAACSPWHIGRLYPAESHSLPSDAVLKISPAFSMSASMMAVAINGVWVIESYKASSLVSPLSSALLFTTASNYWGWEKTLPVYLCLHILSSQHAVHYHTPQFMTDLGAAKSLLPGLVVAYGIPAICAVSGGADESLWPLAHAALPVLTFMGNTFLKRLNAVPQGINVVFSSVDLPYQRRFLTAVMLVASLAHVTLVWSHGCALLTEGLHLLGLPIARTLASLTTVSIVWGMYMAWEMRRIAATEVPLVKAWALLLLSTLAFGPAATLAGITRWSKVELEKATSRQPPVMDSSTNGKSSASKAPDM
ncbi:FAD-binding domain-containing protein [Apiospora hydei]|uniref:FAD-binding domain-containing protein n=1 Tax=Apiospora hydei TaxID=1337664 RepID=A0ABR1VW27_9PEZI